jgi:membrane protease YdiL (CAAX protease family)
MPSNTNPQNSISDKRRNYEITAVVLTGIGKLIFMDLLQWKLPFIIISIVGWGSYVIYQSRKVKGVLLYWGFRTDNFKEVTLRILPFGIVSIIAFIVIGHQRDTINISWHIIPILILYPIWGTIQQFLVIGLVAGNLRDLKESRINEPLIITLTAILFGLIHYPYYWLMFGTFVLALLYGFIYLRGRNVYVMGLFHGWLGGLFFYTVVNRDPFVEVFGKLLN